MSDPTEVILDALIDLNNNGVEELEDYAEDALAALRADGWELYRPEECRKVVVKYGGLDESPMTQVVDWDVGEAWVEADVYDGVYRLVPVSEGTDEVITVFGDWRV